MDDLLTCYYVGEKPKNSEITSEKDPSEYIANGAVIEVDAPFYEFT